MDKEQPNFKQHVSEYMYFTSGEGDKSKECNQACLNESNPLILGLDVNQK